MVKLYKREEWTQAPFYDWEGEVIFLMELIPSWYQAIGTVNDKVQTTQVNTGNIVCRSRPYEYED